jgi:hypothetical protein
MELPDSGGFLKLPAGSFRLKLNLGQRFTDFQFRQKGAARGAGPCSSGPADR